LVMAAVTVHLSEIAIVINDIIIVDNMVIK
jgi:hypothetical protein